MDSEQKKRAIMTLCGGALAFIALFLPLLTVTYAPPGGSALVYGQRMSAFVYVMNGWQLADEATYFKLHLTIIALLTLPVIDFIRLVLPSKSATGLISILAKIFHWKITGMLTDFVQAFVHAIISFVWLAVLFVAALIGSPTMPASGESGLAASFHTFPHVYTMKEALTSPGPTPYLSATVNIGYYLLLLGVVIGIIAVFKKAIALIILLVIALIVTSFFSGPLHQQVLNLLGV